MNPINEKKEKILQIIKEIGPVVPAKISNKIGLSLLFCSALLSEMVREGSLKISKMKIGGSPLYYVEGQEEKLENFISYLNKREQEVFMLLKKEKILIEDKIEPVQRVALSNISDFAKMIMIKIGNEEKKVWYYYLLSKEEVLRLIKEKSEKKREAKEEKEEKKEKVEKIEKKPEKIRKEKRKGKKELIQEIINYLGTKYVEIIEEKKEKDVIGIGEIKTDVGKIKTVIVLKNKKRINENDLNLALAKSHELNMPVLLLTSGELTKKAKEHAKKFGSLIIHKIGE